MALQDVQPKKSVFHLVVFIQGRWPELPLHRLTLANPNKLIHIRYLDARGGTPATYRVYKKRYKLPRSWAHQKCNKIHYYSKITCVYVFSNTLLNGTPWRGFRRVQGGSEGHYNKKV